MQLSKLTKGLEMQRLNADRQTDKFCKLAAKLKAVTFSSPVTEENNFVGKNTAQNLS